MILDGTGISAELYTPIWADNTLVSDDLGSQMTAFSKTEAVDGGWLNASFAAEIHEELLGAWIARIGYDFQVYSDSQQLIWRGFINEIDINYGVYSLKIGPMLNMGNEVNVQYQTMSYATNPPIGGNQTETAVASDTTSQDRYGVLETNISGGQGLAAGMEQLRDTYLNEYKNPETSQQLNLDSVSTPTVTVNLQGYYSLLGRFYFGQSGTGTQTATVKLKAILAAHPTLTFITTAMETNSLAVPVFTDGTKTGLDEARNIVVRGDSSDQRYQFGIYGLTAVYQAIPTSIDSIEYYHILSETGQQVEDTAGAIISPWDIEAGKWLTMLDFVINTAGNVTDLRQDPRNVFIESVTYTAPSSVTITGGKVSQLAQKMAKLGLGGL